MDRAGIQNSDIACITFSGQMMGCLPVDKEGYPLRQSIIWADLRATEQANFIEKQVGMKKVYESTGHRVSASYSGAKILWVKDKEPEIFRRTYKVLHAKDYIVYKLTGRFLTDYSDASGTNAFDLNTFTWSEEIVEAAGISMEILPEAAASTHIAGEITSDAAKECGLKAGTPVVIGGGDGMCASVGAGSVSEGKTYNCLGSSSWICTTSKHPIFDEQYRTFNWAHIVPGMIGPCGTMQTAGAAFAWLKNEICTSEVEASERMLKSPYEIINEEIEASKPGANGLLFLPYLLGERSPRWNSNAKGAFIGLKMEHKRADILRSVVEGIGMNLNIILQIFKQHLAIDEITVIGGMAKGHIERQIFADIFDTRILPLNYLDEATSMGAAVTAGVGIGALKGFDEIYKFIEVNGEEKPIPENAALYRKLQDVFDKAYYSLVQVNDMLSEFK
jgi:xylulokinase